MLDSSFVFVILIYLELFLHCLHDCSSDCQLLYTACHHKNCQSPGIGGNFMNTNTYRFDTRWRYWFQVSTMLYAQPLTQAWGPIIRSWGEYTLSRHRLHYDNLHTAPWLYLISSLLRCRYMQAQEQSTHYEWAWWTREGPEKKRLLTRWLKRGMGEEKVMNVQM